MIVDIFNIFWYDIKSSFEDVIYQFLEMNRLRASSPIWASETSLARTRERAAKPRGAGERRACNDLS